MAVVMGAVPVVGPLTTPGPPEVSASAATGATGPGPSPGGGEPSAERTPTPSEPAGPAGAPGRAPLTVATALTELGTLHREAEAADARYRTAKRQLIVQRTRTIGIGQRLTAARRALADSRVEVGRIAREQYQGQSELGELSQYLRVLLSRDPQRAVDTTHLWERIAADRLATVARLTTDTRRASSLAAASRKAYDRELALAARQKKAQETAAARLKAIEELLASLSPAQLAALAEVENGRVPLGTEPPRPLDEATADETTADETAETGYPAAAAPTSAR